MGLFYVAVVHRRDGTSTRTEFADYDVALTFARARLESKEVARVEICFDHRLVWAEGEGVITGSNH